jgi:uncharacterized protein YjbI with pentapeptide repeats
LAAASVAAAAVKPQSAPQDLSATEKWVVEKVTAGELADLSEKFPDNKEKRKLSAHFLEALLMGTLPGFKPHRNGVQIVGAVSDDPIDLTNAQIPCEVSFVDCQFMRHVSFNRASLAGNVTFDRSVFEEDVHFNSMKVGHLILFRDAEFKDSVNFGAAEIAGDLLANGAQFENKEQKVRFDRMKVGGTAFFRDAEFEGPVNFGSADIASNFEAQGAKFRQDASFDGMKVRESAFFTNAIFEGPVEFASADIASDFDAQGAKFQNKKEEARFIAMKVEGAASFNNAVFNGSVNFSYADFAWLQVSSPFWPKVAAQFQMQGMSYRYIRAVPGNEGNEPESHKALLRLADQSAYTADVYGSLEKFFLQQGYRDDADRAFIAGKRRERKEKLHGFDWAGSWLLDKLVGYGRHPWQASIPCAVLVALGCVLFSPRKMEPQTPTDAPRVYNRFWYSLGLFLPVVNLQSSDVWKPKSDCWFLRHYVRVQILLGWILIPILLAAIGGLIK